MPGNWVTGLLAQNVWSVASDSNTRDVNSFLFQYFINYNLENGWYLSTTPVITANWEADSDNRRTVPFGGGIGKLVKHDKQPVDYKLTAYYNAEKPEYFLWRFMIAPPFQRRGFGAQAIARLIDYVKSRPNATELFVSYIDHEDGPAAFYRGLGFRETGEVEENEIMMRLDLQEWAQPTSRP